MADGLNLIEKIINHRMDQKRSGYSKNLSEDKWPSDKQVLDAVTLEINMMTNVEVIELISNALDTRYD